MSQPLGNTVLANELATDPVQFNLVESAWKAAQRAACFRSRFPVGSAILAEDAIGHTEVFSGCNVENRYFPATICAERNAATTAIANGFTIFRLIAIACPKVPGGNSCGLCRQVLTEWGYFGTILNILDSDFNIRSFPASELLPAASGQIERRRSLSKTEQKLVSKLLKRKSASHAPYSDQASAAVCIAHNSAGKSRNFYGVTDDNASYGGSTNAEVAAMTAARANGFDRNVTLAVNCTGPIHGPNPIDGESLQKLREFGPEAEILLVDDQGNAIRTSLTELLPDAFGPDSL